VDDLATTNTFDEEKLISLVFNYRYRYGKTDRFYEDNSVGNNQWKETAGLMSEPGEHEIDPYN
jgi:hypothetical protein